MGKIKNWTKTEGLKLFKGMRSFAWRHDKKNVGVWVDHSVRIGGGWEVAITLKVPKSFKTQSGALNYAKNYMEAHPNG